MKQRFRQFGIRSIALLTLVVAAYLAIRLSAPVRQRDAVVNFENSGGNVFYQDTTSDDSIIGTLLGKKYTGTVDFIDLFGADVGDEKMIHLRSMDNVRELRLPGTRVTDNGLQHVAHLTKLEWLDLSATDVTGSGFVHLASLDNLQRLDLTDTKVNDDGLSQLASLENLKRIALAGTEITDAGIIQLAKVPNLATLHLGRTVITDSCIPQLAKMLALTTLTVQDSTQLTDSALETLMDVNPQLKIYKTYRPMDRRTTD